MTITEIQTLINTQQTGVAANITAAKRRSVDNALLEYMSDLETRLAVLEAASGGGGGPQVNAYIQNNTYWLETSTMRVGVDLLRGGVLRWFGTLADNYVDDNDNGRYNGVSIYSNPEPYNIAGKTAHPAYTTTSWNPVQAGNVGNNNSGIIGSATWNPANLTLTVQSRPQQWKFLEDTPDPDVVITTTYTVNPSRNALKCKYVVNVTRSARNDAGRPDETGFWYWKRDLDVIRTYTGNAPWTNAAAETPSYTFNNDFGETNSRAIFSPPSERWIHLRNSSSSKGVGMFYRNNEVSDDNGQVHKSDTYQFILVQVVDTFTDTGTFTKTTERDLVLGDMAAIRTYAYDWHNNIV